MMVSDIMADECEEGEETHVTVKVAVPDGVHPRLVEIAQEEVAQILKDELNAAVPGAAHVLHHSCGIPIIVVRHKGFAAE